MRIQSLIDHTDEIRGRQRIDLEMQSRMIPSATQILAIKDTDGSYLVVNGNGRLSALRSTFSRESDIEVQVEVLDVDDEQFLNYVREFQKRNHGAQFKWLCLPKPNYV